MTVSLYSLLVYRMLRAYGQITAVLMFSINALLLLRCCLNVIWSEKVKHVLKQSADLCTNFWHWFHTGSDIMLTLGLLLSCWLSAYSLTLGFWALSGTLTWWLEPLLHTSRVGGSVLTSDVCVCAVYMFSPCAPVPISETVCCKLDGISKLSIICDCNRLASCLGCILLCALSLLNKWCGE